MRMGIIPALAGNIPPFYKNGALTWDHPRACGEHLRNKNVLADSAGSSPRLRGTFCLPSDRQPAGGIIPALAGNIGCCFWRALATGDHPRACGEHTSRPRTMNPSVGSSPRLRGTFRQPLFSFRARGIIPALAGNITVILQNLSADRDHLRACGEHLPAESTIVNPLGSSPRLRGT